MTRRPWLVVVVLVLLGISATTFVKASRAYRPDDAVALAFDDGITPCEVPVLAPPHEHLAILELVVPRLPRTATGELLSFAPKTSPPHRERRSSLTVFSFMWRFLHGTRWESRVAATVS